jgi:hypothetical protein
MTQGQSELRPLDNFKFMGSWPAWVRWIAVIADIVVYTCLFVWLVQSDMAWNWQRFGVILVILGFLSVWGGIAIAPRFKVIPAIFLGLLAMSLASHPWMTDYPYPSFAWFVGTGVAIAWAFSVWGYLRSRRRNTSRGA